MDYLIYGYFSQNEEPPEGIYNYKFAGWIYTLPNSKLMKGGTFSWLGHYDVSISELTKKTLRFEKVYFLNFKKYTMYFKLMSVDGTFYSGTWQLSYPDRTEVEREGTAECWLVEFPSKM